MDGSVSISIGSILAVVGFVFQIGLTVAAIAFSHGALNQRVRQVEEKVKDQGQLANNVTRLEAEMESVGREIKGLRHDLQLARSELRNDLRYRQINQAQSRQQQRSPYDFPQAREWVLEDEQ